MKSYLKKILQSLGIIDTYYMWLIRNRSYIRKTLRKMHGNYPRECPCCGYSGSFKAFGDPPRFDARCPNCRSLERHRLLVLIDKEHEILSNIGTLLHFAPEKCLKQLLQNRPKKYYTADLYKNNVDYQLDIEDIALPEASIDSILCSHVLEHVDDIKAIDSIYKTLKPNGSFITSVPICEGLDVTYENPNIKDPNQREIYYGQSDHVRLYGRDFIHRLESAGFLVKVLHTTPEQCVKYSLCFGDKVYVGKKDD